MAKTNENKNLTAWECERIDFIQDKAREFLDSLMMKDNEAEWTMDDLNAVLAVAWNCMKEKDIDFTEREFYPYRNEEEEEEEEGDVQAIVEMADEINKYTRFLLAYEDEGLVCIEYLGETKQAVADAIEESIPHGMTHKLEWVKSDEAVNTAWFKVK